MKGQTIISPNTPTDAPVRNWKRPALVTSPQMRIAQERASAVQPPIRSIFGKKKDLRRGECKSGV